jgi:glycosyltransferase involved in cell wall biosynthesis
MKVLFLCKKFPYPLKDGESIAVSNLCRDLNSLGCELSLLSMNTSKHYSDLSALPAAYNYFKTVHTVDIDNSIKPWKAITSLVTGESYHVSRFRSGAFRAKLIEVLTKESFDIIQLETLYLAPYIDTIRAYSNAPIVMRAHNVEHEIWERITSNTTSPVKKFYLTQLTRQLKAYELEQFPAYDYLVTLTDRDLQHFKSKGYNNGATAAPIGFDISSYPVTRSLFGKSVSLCFIGSLDWMPNREGLEWFLNECWPAIHTRWPQITFHIAGRNTPAAFLNQKWPGVTVHGEVPDATAFVQQHGVMIVPLFSGSGMRVKIVEGMLMGKVVITTAVGKEGIEGEDGHHFLVADTKEQMINAVRLCVEQPEMASRIGQEALANAALQFDSIHAARKILGIYHQLLGYHQDATDERLKSISTFNQ